MRTTKITIKDILHANKNDVRISYYDLTEDFNFCPNCGKFCKCHDKVFKWAQDINLDYNQWICIRISVFSCDTCKEMEIKPYHFRTDTSGFVEKWKRNTNRVFEKIKNGCSEIGLNHSENARRMQIDFHTTTVPGTVWKTINNNEEIKQMYNEYQNRAIATFSGQASIDETYTGDLAMVTMTDSLNGRELGHLVLKSTVNKDLLRPFLIEMKEKGLYPKFVTRDGSPLYPDLLEEIWPDSKQGSCHFHIIQNVNKFILTILCIFRKKLKVPKLPKGRPTKALQEVAKKIKELKATKTEILRYRHLCVKKNHTDEDKEKWKRMVKLIPELHILRQCVLDFYAIIESKDKEQFESKRQAWFKNNAYNKYCKDVFLFLEDDKKIEYITNYLNYENAQKTSNDVERDNRRWKRRQKSHERLRKIETADIMKKIDAIQNGNKNNNIYLLLGKM
jgi:hypothetical protein